MERLPKCQICLAENVRMHIVGKHLHKVYEMLTNTPIITEDRKPTLACYFCYSKLEQHYKLEEHYLEAEKLIDQMFNEPNASSIRRGKSVLYNGLTKSPMEETINITGDSLIHSIAIQIKIQKIMSKTNKEIEHEDALENGDREVLGKKRDVTSTNVAKNLKCGSLRKKLDKIVPEEQKENRIPETNIVKSNRIENVVFKEPPKCHVCKRGFIFKNNLLKHIRTHTEEKPFKCDICQCRYNKKSDLILHMRTHTGEKQYTCKSCQHAYNSHGDLMKHMRKHNGEKRYKCGICQCNFNTKLQYIHHIRMHIGKKRY